MAMTMREKRELGDALRASFGTAIDNYTNKRRAAREGGAFAGYMMLTVSGHLTGFVSAVHSLARCLDGTGDGYFHQILDDFWRQIDDLDSQLDQEDQEGPEGGGADA